MVAAAVFGALSLVGGVVIVNRATDPPTVFFGMLVVMAGAMMLGLAAIISLF